MCWKMLEMLKSRIEQCQGFAGCFMIFMGVAPAASTPFAQDRSGSSFVPGKW